MSTLDEITNEIDEEQEKNGTKTTAEILVQEIYNDILKEICVDVACDIHRMVKTGAAAALSNPSRTEVYPQIHKQGEDINEKLERYATDQPLSKRFKPMIALICVDNDEGSATETVADTPTNDRVTRHQQNHTDIWGRIPSKEPREMAFCKICSRHVSVARFAPHLDKCMGIGTTTRAATTTVRP
jgi:hypothetical protein